MKKSKKMSLPDQNQPVVMGSDKDVYVSFTLAKLAKEVGFNIGVQNSVTEYVTEQVDEQDGTSGPFGWEKGELEYGEYYFCNNSTTDYSNESFESYALPTLAVLQAWLREVRGMKVWCSPSQFSSDSSAWAFNILQHKDGKLLHHLEEGPGNKQSSTYDEALNDGLILAIQLMLKNE